MSVYFHIDKTKWMACVYRLFIMFIRSINCFIFLDAYAWITNNWLLLILSVYDAFTLRFYYLTSFEIIKSRFFLSYWNNSRCRSLLGNNKLSTVELTYRQINDLFKKCCSLFHLHSEKVNVTVNCKITLMMQLLPFKKGFKENVHSNLRLLLLTLIEGFGK